MKVFFDTNVLIAALVSRGSCGDLLDHCIVEHIVCTSEHVLGELVLALDKKFGFGQAVISQAAEFIRRNSMVVDPAGILSPPVCRDSDDDIILSAALESDADCIISGDKDLLVIKEFKGIPILKPAAFWAFEAGKTGPSPASDLKPRGRRTGY